MALKLADTEVTTYISLVRILLADWPNYTIAHTILEIASPNFDRDQILALFHVALRGGIGFDILISRLTNELLRLKSPNLLFREESSSTVMFSYWLRSEEITYFGDILDYQIRKLVSLEEQLNNDDKLPQLISVTQHFLDCVLKSTSQLTTNTRRLFAEVYKLLQKQFPDTPKQNLKREIVSTLFFVRFLCPELSLGKAREYAKGSTLAQKNLILVSKLLVTVSTGNPNDSHPKLVSKLISDNIEKLDRFCYSLMKVNKNRNSQIIEELSEFEGLGFDPVDCVCLANFVETKFENLKTHLRSVPSSSSYVIQLEHIHSEILRSRLPKNKNNKRIPLPITRSPSNPSPSSIGDESLSINGSGSLNGPLSSHSSNTPGSPTPGRSNYSTSSIPLVHSNLHHSSPPQLSTPQDKTPNENTIPTSSSTEFILNSSTRSNPTKVLQTPSPSGPSLSPVKKKRLRPSRTQK